jgi:hypothetical protein
MIYHVTGSAIAGKISNPARKFSINVCSNSKSNAYSAASASMASRGYRGIVCIAAESCGNSRMYNHGDTLLIES